MSHMPTSSGPAQFATAPSVSLINGSGGVIKAGAAVYSSSNGVCSNALADTLATATVVGIAMADIGIGASGLIQTGAPLALSTSQWDLITSDSGGLVAGKQYWLSPVTGGHLIRDVAPSAATQYDTLCGVAVSTTTLSISVAPPIGPL